MTNKCIAWPIRPIFAIAAVAVAGSFTPSLAADDIGSAMAPSGGERSAGWSPDRMQRATERVIPNVDPASVKAEIAAMDSAKDPSEAVEKTGERGQGDLYQKPLKWVGKLFYTTPDGDYNCTAQFISPNVILTAAQCVRDDKTGDFFTDFVFALQYKSGKYVRAYGYKCAATKNAWVQDGNERYAYDYATILIDGESESGYFGTHRAWPANAYPEAVMTAYTNGIADGGVVQAIKGAVTLYKDGVVGLNHGNKADITGAAGGAFVGSYTEGPDRNGNFVISVDSFTYGDEPGVNYGPYLNDDFKSLWDYTENSCQNP
ncbi:MAG: trypsin-like serine protease [Bauldia sp.]|nr:trypsin-like serine protease [Bauldia sp.]